MPSGLQPSPLSCTFSLNRPVPYSCQSLYHFPQPLGCIIAFSRNNLHSVMNITCLLSINSIIGMRAYIPSAFGVKHQ